MKKKTSKKVTKKAPKKAAKAKQNPKVTKPKKGAALKGASRILNERPVPKEPQYELYGNPPKGRIEIKRINADKSFSFKTFGSSTLGNFGITAKIGVREVELTTSNSPDEIDGTIYIKTTHGSSQTGDLTNEDIVVTVLTKKTYPPQP